MASSWPSSLPMHCLKAFCGSGLTRLAVVAGCSVVLAQSPARAGDYTFTINGFQGAFSEDQWTGTPGLGGSGSITSPQMQIQGSANLGSSFEYEFDTTGIAALVPQSLLDDDYGYVGGTVAFDWSWNTVGANFPSVSPFTYQIGSAPAVSLPTKIDPNASGFNINNWILTGTQFSFFVPANTTFSFAIRNNDSNLPATFGQITNFSFTGVARKVPGPLPVLAGMAGFAWSRKLRRRLVSHRRQLG